MHYPLPLLKLIELLRKLPGVGSKSAERFAFDMIDWPEQDQRQFGELVSTLGSRLQRCRLCGCFTHSDRCAFCDDATRDTTTLCVISSPRNAYTIERTGEYRGLYHVLGGLLSPLDGKRPEDLHIDALKQRITTLGAKELVLALDSTLEGDATALYLSKQIASLPLNTSRLALGLPVGSSIDYVDGGTLAHALVARTRVSGE